MNVFSLKEKEKSREKKEGSDGRLKSLPVFVAYNSPLPPFEYKKKKFKKKSKNTR